MVEPDSKETLSYSKLTMHRKTRTGNLALTQQYKKTYLTILFRGTHCSLYVLHP